MQAVILEKGSVISEGKEVEIVIPEATKEVLKDSIISFKKDGTGANQILARMTPFIDYHISTMRAKIPLSIATEDLRQELQLFLFELINPSKNRKDLDISKSEKQIINYLNYALKQKLYRIIRDQMVTVCKKSDLAKIQLTEEDKKMKKGKLRRKYAQHYFKNPIDSVSLSFNSSEDDNIESDTHTALVDATLFKNNQYEAMDLDGLFFKMEMDELKKQMSFKAQEVLDKASQILKDEFLSYIDGDKAAKEALKTEVIPVLRGYYGNKFKGKRNMFR